MSEPKPVTSQIGEDRIREAFQYAASGMAITDLEGRFQESNAAYREIVKRTQKELEQESILSITHRDDRAGCREHLDRLISGELPSFVLEKRYLRPDGSTVWVQNSFSLLKDHDGAPAHIVLMCNDVTDHRRAEQLLIQTEKLAIVGRLAASIAHEINNPLEAVLNLLYLIREADDLQQVREFAGQAEEEIQRAAHITRQTLQFQRRQARPAPTDLAQLLESVLALFRGKVIAARIRVEFENTDHPQLLCYPDEIRQVFANLVRNAIEAMPKGGKLRLRVRPSTEWRSGAPGVRVTIADTGYGMSAQTRRQIFRPFFTTKGEMGTGLGLWVTAGILEKHRGTLHLRSSDVPGSSGTAFMLIFPVIGAQGKEEN